MLLGGSGGMLPQKILQFSAFWGTELSTKECVFHSRKCNLIPSRFDYQPHNLQAMNKGTFEQEQILFSPPKKINV